MTPEIDFEIRLADGDLIKVNVPAATSRERRTFVFGVHKSGSTLLDKVVHRVCAIGGVPYANIESQIFQQGVPLHQLGINDWSFIEQSGVVYSGFRSLWIDPAALSADSVRSLLLVRDPRDALVSYYFSDKQSHGIPNGKVAAAMKSNRMMLQATDGPEDAREYLESRASHLRRSIRRYLGELPETNTTILRYEDIIFYKEAFVAFVAQFLGADISLSSVQDTAASVDEVPLTERPDKHVRSVIPGNHRRHLSRSTINWLNSFFAYELDTLGYDSLSSYRQVASKLVPATLTVGGPR